MTTTTEENTIKYLPACRNVPSLDCKVPALLANDTANALANLDAALGGDVAGFVANRLAFSQNQLVEALAAEQVDGVALAIYNIEARGEAVIIGDQTGIGKGRQAAAMVRYGILSGYFPIYFTDKYTLFSDMYRDCKALAIQDKKPLIINKNVSVVDFDRVVEIDADVNNVDEDWSRHDDDDDELFDATSMSIYRRQYEEVFHSLKTKELNDIYQAGQLPDGVFDYMMITYSQLKDTKRDRTRLDFLKKLCHDKRVIFIFDEAHKSSSVAGNKMSVITQSINDLLEVSPKNQCVFLSATFAKRPECMITFMQRTALGALATQDTLRHAFSGGGVPMQEYVSATLASEGQMIRREHSGVGIPDPVYTYLDERFSIHSQIFDAVMYWFREMLKLSAMVAKFISLLKEYDGSQFRVYPARGQLFYINKVLLLALKATDVAAAAVREVRQGRSVVIGMSDTLECVLRDSVDPMTGECARGDFSTLLLRVLEKVVVNSKDNTQSVFDIEVEGNSDSELTLRLMLDDIRHFYDQIKSGVANEIFHIPMSPIDVIRQLITREKFVDPDGLERNIRFEECTGRANCLEYDSPDGLDDFRNASLRPRRKRHSNILFNDFQNNKVDVILINACGAIGASAHAIETSQVDADKVRQRKMLIVQNDLDVNIDLQKRGRINRTGQLFSLPPLYEYIITAIPSEKRLNMMLRAKLRSLSANTTANQNQVRSQADFIDISNAYGNMIAREYLSSHSELAHTLGLQSNSTASQLMARLAMMSVNIQQEVIDEIFSQYLALEQELRRTNQWDLEQEFRDFKAKFVGEELFTSAIEDTPLGGESRLSTFLCRHRTYPYTSKALIKEVEKNRKRFGPPFRDNAKLRGEMKKWFDDQKDAIVRRFETRRSLLEDNTTQFLLKYFDDSAKVDSLMKWTQEPKDRWPVWAVTDALKFTNRPKIVERKLLAWSAGLRDLANRRKRALDDVDDQWTRLQYILQYLTIGTGFHDILKYFPMEGSFSRVAAVLKDIRFGKTKQNRFLPSQVTFVFALSAGSRELHLNIVHNSAKTSNFEKLSNFVFAKRWSFDAAEWDEEISKNNNQIIPRKIITGNILGAFAHPAIAELNPRFITFSLAGKGVRKGLLLPLSGINLNLALSNVTIPIAQGLRFANVSNASFPITGAGVNFNLLTFRDSKSPNLKYAVAVYPKESKEFEKNRSFDSIRHLFNASNNPSSRMAYQRKFAQRQYVTPHFDLDSPDFLNILNLLSSLKATILIPRSMMTTGQMANYINEKKSRSYDNWPALDWKKGLIDPPIKKQTDCEISLPQRQPEVEWVDEYSIPVKLAHETLKFDGADANDRGVAGPLKDLYLKWLDYLMLYGATEPNKDDISLIAHHLHYLLSAGKSSSISLSKCRKALDALVASEKLGPVPQTIQRFKRDFLFQAPDKKVVKAFLDDCLCDSRLDSVRASLTAYLKGKTPLIQDSIDPLNL